MTARGEKKLLTASDLANLCQVDLKTIHNWVDRGRIPHFRTPGRHLRFRSSDVAEFLRTWGYAVPRDLARAASKVVGVVGTEETVARVTTAAPGVTVQHLAHPYDALVSAGADAPDAYVVDIAFSSDGVDVHRLLEVLHRACPQAKLIALTDDLPGMPSGVSGVSPGDDKALESELAALVVAAAEKKKAN